MSVFAKVAFAVIMIVLTCLLPIQPTSGGGTGVDHEQPLLLDHSYVTENATLLKESQILVAFGKILLMLCFTTIVFQVFLRFRMKRYVFSFIPLMKRFFLLFPIKYESRYIVSPHFISSIRYEMGNVLHDQMVQIHRICRTDHRNVVLAGHDDNQYRQGYPLGAGFAGWF